MAKAFGNLDSFFDSFHSRYESLTFDDVLMEPGHSDIYPHMTDLRTRITRGISCRVPILSSAMETVTEAPMAIALAKAGGIGIIHRLFKDPAAQAGEVERVKYEMSKLIRSPLTKSPEMKVAQLKDWLAERAKNGKTVFDTHPVVDKAGHLLGLVGGKDIRYCRDTSLTLREVMTPFNKLVKAKTGIAPEDAYAQMMRERVSALPLIGPNRLMKEMYLLSDLERKLASDGGGYNLDDDGQLIVGAAIGTGSKETERAEALIAAKVNLITIDTAHGDSKGVMNQIREVKRLSDRVQVLAGNVATGDGAIRLAKAGADGIKVGIGPGSICTTRIVTGVGVPQMTAVHKCARAVRELDIPICADGGIRASGDMVKALAAGASSVMLGSILAGTDESPGEVIVRAGREYKRYRGMGSASVMAKSGDRYRQNSDDFVPEGVEGAVPYQGSVNRVVGKIAGGIRSGLGYLGVREINEMPNIVRFTRISNNGLRESHPHDVILDGMSSFMS